MSRSLSFQVTGMHCPACEFLVADELGPDPAVASLQVTRSDNRLRAELHEEEDPAVVKARWNRKLDPYGYRLWHEDEDPRVELWKETGLGVALGAVFLAVFAGLQTSGLVELFTPDSLGLPGAFVLGLLASVSSCFALVGGLLVSYTAAVGKRRPGDIGPGLVAFHGARLGIFFVGGGILGLAGAALGTSADLQKILLTAAALVMAGLGANLLGLKLPALPASKKGTARAQGLAAWGSVGGGALLGLSTFFLPCGFTQSVQFQALTAGGFLEAGTLTLVFALGTLPVLASVGWLLGKGLVGQRRAVMLKAGATAILGLGLFQLWGALHLWGLNL